MFALEMSDISHSTELPHWAHEMNDQNYTYMRAALTQQSKDILLLNASITLNVEINWTLCMS